jgi:lysophospholipase L1-like esterase
VNRADTLSSKFCLGYSGYNARWDALMFRDLFPTQEEQKYLPRIAMLTVWLGTNDSTFPGSTQHVPLDAFVAALKDIFAVVRERSPQTKIILITPPPIYVKDVEQQLYSDPPRPIDRSVDLQGRYAKAVKTLGEDEGIPVVDAWDPIWEAAGSREEEAVRPFLSDGLHLNGKGYQV